MSSKSLLLMSFAVMVGCSAQHISVLSRQPAPNMRVMSAGILPKGKTELPTTVVSTDWKPQDVALRCTAESCPAGVGVVLFIHGTSGKDVLLSRCSAFLSAPDRIVTSSHCNLSGEEKGYFVVRSPGGAIETRAVGSALHSAFTPSLDPAHPDWTSGRPDLAVFPLDQSIDDIPHLDFDRANGIPFGVLTAYVINDDADAKQGTTGYTIDARACTFRRQLAFFDFAETESVDVWTGFDCNVVPGNSGSPLIGTNGLVEAVVQAGDDGSLQAQDIRTRFHREPLAFESHRTVVATNPRCLDFMDLGGATCVAATPKELQSRFQKDLNQFIQSLVRMPVPNPDQYPTGFSVNLNQFESPIDIEPQYDLSYVPNCRRTGGDLSQTVIPSRHLQITYDDWANPQVSDLGTFTSPAPATALGDDKYSLKIQWTAAFGKYMKPELDLRRQMGESFSVELKDCAR